MTKTEFAKFLAIMASTVPNGAPKISDPLLVDVWFQHLGDLTSEEVQVILSKLAMSCDRFPSIKQLREFIGKGETTEDEKCRHAADRIAAAVVNFGMVLEHDTQKEEKLNTYLGDLALKVVQRHGGWYAVVKQTDHEDMGTLKAQWRETARYVDHQALKGDDGPPKLSAAIGKALVLASSSMPVVIGEGETVKSKDEPRIVKIDRAKL